MDINSLQQQVNFLSDRINFINETLKFNIGTFLTVLAIGLALAGGAAIVMAKYLFNKRFDEEAKKIDNKIKDFVINNPQYLCSSGQVFLKGNGMLQGNKVKFPVMEKRDLEVVCMNKLDIKPLHGNKILSYKACVKNGYLEIEFQNFEPDTDIGIEWHLMYLNKIYDEYFK
jgi:hypothetical protein